MLEVGDQLPPWRVASVDPAQMKALAELLADPNPIHLDAQAVRQLGLGDRVINQGPANLAYAVNLFQSALPGAVIEQLDARFMANVCGGDAVEARATVTAVDAAHRRVTLEYALHVAGGNPAVAGIAVLRLPPEPGDHQ